MKVLVTGGAGYMGTELINLLVANDSVEQVIIYDNLSRLNYNLFLGLKLQIHSKGLSENLQVFFSRKPGSEIRAFGQPNISKLDTLKPPKLLCNHLATLPNTLKTLEHLVSLGQDSIFAPCAILKGQRRTGIPGA